MNPGDVQPVESGLVARWQAAYGHLPWFRRYEFLLPATLFIAIAARFVLPEHGRPEEFIGVARVAGVFLGYFALAIIVITDREKPTALKRAYSLGVILLFFFFFYRYSGTRWDRVHSQFFNLERMEGVWPLYLRGLRVTLQLSLVSAAIALPLGLLLGFLRSLHNTVLEIFLAVYIDFFRAMPLIVNMVLVFYALPFLGVNLGAFWAATTALVLMNSAYQAEIFRAGIESVSRRQVDAARALGMRPLQILRLVVLPQSVRVILPPLSNNLVSLVKDTAVAYVITVPELLTEARQAVVWKRNPSPLILSMFVYLATLIPLIRAARYLEHRSKRWVKT